MPDNYHARLSAEAESLWVDWMARNEDHGRTAEHGFNVLSTAAALAEAHGLAWGEEGEITDDRLQAIVDDFALTLGKTCIDLAPDRVSDAVRARIELLDLRVKQSRDMPTEGGTA